MPEKVCKQASVVIYEAKGYLLGMKGCKPAGGKGESGCMQPAIRRHLTWFAYGKVDIGYARMRRKELV
jgi:hypothetical protein